ncbi:glycosyltransferase [Olivibacter jilunii]|uniref:glycosyltransferase n=1 Tax=Olivibacter jilunii TaxID=985016 RepID=UPI003F1772B4
MGKATKIIFDPVFMSGNKYVEIMVAGLKERGIEPFSLGQAMRKPALFLSIKIAHVNWFEGLIGKNSLSLFIYFLRQLLKFSALKLTGKKIIWTLHNKKPHEEGFQTFKQLLFNMMVRQSDVIVVHNKASITWLEENYNIARKKIVFVPHPNYIGVYGPILENNSVRQGELRLLFFGAIKPYKNIELLIESIRGIPEKVSLTIIGEPSSTEYANKLTKCAEKMPNVHFRYEFVSNDSLNELLPLYDILVLPYNIQSSLNSGTVLLAFSYQRTVICPRIGTLADFPEEGWFFSYEYNSPEEHIVSLRNAIMEAFKKEDPHFFKQAGVELYQQVRKLNDPKLISGKLVHIYENLLGENKNYRDI